MEYQHVVYIWDYDTGLVQEGVFKTDAEAMGFYYNTPGGSRSKSAELGTRPYGIFAHKFDAKASLEAMGAAQARFNDLETETGIASSRRND